MVLEGRPWAPQGQATPQGSQTPHPPPLPLPTGVQSFLDPPHTTWDRKVLFLTRSLLSRGSGWNGLYGKPRCPRPGTTPCCTETFPDGLHPQTSRLIRTTRPMSTSSPLTRGLGHTHRGTPGPSQQGTPLGPFPLGGDNSRESSLALWTADVHLFQKEKMNVNTVIYQQP